ncbi:MAG: hypothetical protein R3C10_04145 [Pirellulales bacterium]
MAENEQLDASKSRKWRAVARAVAAKVDSDIIAAEVDRVFCQALRDVKKDGDLPGMIRLLDQPQQLDRLLSDWEGDPLVADLLAEASRGHGPLEQRLGEALDQMLGNCLYDVPTLATTCDPPITITEARDRLETALIARRSEIVRRIADKLAANPDWEPKARSRTSDKASPSFSSTEQMLGESLLKGLR